MNSDDLELELFTYMAGWKDGMQGRGAKLDLNTTHPAYRRGWADGQRDLKRAEDAERERLDSKKQG